MILKQCIMTNSLCYKNNQGLPKIMGIVVHSTGCNNTSLKRYIQPFNTDKNYDAIMADLGTNIFKNDWNHTNREAGVHAFIGKNKNGIIETYQTLPYTYCAWGVGRGRKIATGSTYYSDKKLTKRVGITSEGLFIAQSYTSYSTVVIGGITYYVSNNSRLSYNYAPNARIQFEICEDALTNETYFNAVMKEAQEYCAYLCKLFNLDVKQICSHRESYILGYGGNHGDPDSWMVKFGKDMDWFREEVQKILDPKPIVEPTPVAQIKVGDLVSIVSDAVYYSGKAVPDWVKNQNWYVRAISGDRAVIDKNEAGTNSICSPINIKCLYPIVDKVVLLQKGDKVKLNKGAKWVTGKVPSSWVYNMKLTIMSVVDDKARVSAATNGLAYTGTAYLKDLTKV